MAQLMAQGKQQYFDDNGGPLSGGKLWTYAAGTTTPLATYSDAAGTTPNTNPVVLNARGEATIFWSAAPYKVVLTDASDVTIWTQDNISTPLAELSGASGSALVGFSQSVSYAAGTVGAALKRVVSVTDEPFGATGDGVTDDTAAILAAILAVASTTGLSSDGDPTGALYFPSGVYRITQSGVFSALGDTLRSGVLCFGDGPGNTIIWLDPSGLSADAYFYDNGASARSWNATFRDMSFRGGATWRTLGLGYANFNAFCKGFKFSGPTWESAHVFDNVEFAFLDTVLETAGSNNADTIRFSRCMINKCRRTNYLNNLQSMGVTWSQCYGSNLFGNFLEYGSAVSGGAGNFSCTDSSLIFTPDTFGGGDAWAIDARIGGPSAAQAPIRFSGCRFELRGELSDIGSATFSSVMAIFDSCSFLCTATLPRKIAAVADGTSMQFDKCSFSHEGGGTGKEVEWEITTVARRAKNGSFVFRDCFVSDWDSYTFTFTRGAIVTEGCWIASSDFSAEPFVRLVDGVVLGTDATNNTAYRPRASQHANPLRGGTLPLTTGNEQTVSLPRGALIVRIRVVLAAGASGSTGSNYRLLVGSNDKLTVYAESVVGAQNAGFTINADVSVKLGTAIADRTVRLWADDGAGGTSGAGSPAPVLCDIEYI